MKSPLPYGLDAVRIYFGTMNLENRIVLDIGGTFWYRKFLGSAFKQAKILVLNIDADVLKGTSDSFIGDGLRLPFRDGSCDIVTSFSMIEHLVDPDTFVSECYRVLKDDGRFVIATCNLADIYSRLTFLFGYQPFMYNPSRLRIAVPFGRIDTYMGHKSVFTFRGLKDFLRNHGFGIEGSCGYSYAHDVYFGYDSNRRKREVGFYGIRKVLNRVSPKLAREGMLFICRKNNPLD